MLIPDLLNNISDPPKEIYVNGRELEEILKMPRLAVVGSRKVTAYGQQVTTNLVRELSRSGVAIISGLAYGVDSLAHRAALDEGGVTVAVLPSPLENIAPKQHTRLAKEIAFKGGALVSEYPAGASIHKTNFIARNRIVSGLSDAVLITEAAEKSGSLHTARFAIEQGKQVLAVPGNINSPMSAGTNNLIKQGATPVTSAADVFFALGMEPSAQKTIKSSDPLEQSIINLLQSGITDGEEIQQKSQLEIGVFNQTLTMMEITGIIRPLGANHWALC